MDKKLGFVILNYNGDDVTINCVDSLIKFYPEAAVCIVDNNSQNKSVDNILNRYKEQSNITILKADKNYGFAVGNNIGINYLREEGCEYVGVINNDTIFQNGELYDKLDVVAEDEAVLGLELDNLDGTKQVPYGLIKGASRTYIKTGIAQFMFLTGLRVIYRFFKNLFKRKKNVAQTQVQPEIDFSEYDYTISGAAYILTPAFFRYYNQLFNKTFMYCEENILALYLKKAKLKTKLIRDTKIIHLESQTARLGNYSRKKIKMGHASWWKGLGVFFGSQKRIVKKYSNKNYNFEKLK